MEQIGGSRRTEYGAVVAVFYQAWQQTAMIYMRMRDDHIVYCRRVEAPVLVHPQSILAKSLEHAAIEQDALSSGSLDKMFGAGDGARSAVEGDLHTVVL